MRKCAALTACGLWLLLPAVAGAQGISGGLKGGALLSSIPKFTEGFSASGIEVGRRLGFTGGAFLTLSLLPGFAIQPEVILTQKGVSVTSPSGDFDLRLDYVDIPVLARLSAGAGLARVYLFAGPSFNINLKAELTNAGSAEDVKEDVGSSEVAVVAGLGVEVGKFLVEGRWIEGMKDIAKSSGEDYKTRTFAIMAGIRF